MKTYRAALVGTGSISEAHVRAVEATQGRVVLEAAVDIDATRVADFARRHGIPQHFTDYEGMLDTLRPDFVLVATPPSMHAPMSIAAMQRGGRDADNRLARTQQPGAVDHEEAHQFKARKRPVGEVMHPGKGERFVMGEFERFDALIKPHLAHEGAHTPQPLVGLRERADQHTGEKHLIEQADVAHRHVSGHGSAARYRREQRDLVARARCERRLVGQQRAIHRHAVARIVDRFGKNSGQRRLEPGPVERCRQYK
jgi:hypothetical protein